MSKTPEYIIAFAEAVYPGFPELGLSMARSEEAILRDATKVVTDLRAQLTLAEKKLELATVGLGMIRELDRIGEGVPPKEVSDYEQGMGSGFEIAAEIAVTTVNNIEETEAKYKRERMLEEL